MNNIIRVSGLVLFFFILIFPAEQLIIKLPFLLIVLFSWMISVLFSKEITFYKPVLFLISLIVAKGIIWTILGFLNGNSGAVKLINVNITWYILYAILISKIREIKDFNLIIYTLIFSGLVVTIIDLYFILMTLKILPELNFLNIFNEDEFYFSMRSGFSYLQTNHLNNLVFIYPLTFTLLISPNDPKSVFLMKKWFLVTFFLLQMILMFFSGRRILWLILLAGPFFVFILTYLTSRKRHFFLLRSVLKYYLFIGSILVVAISFWFANLDISLSVLSENFAAAFNSNEESTRFEQSSILLSKFYESPIFGHGAAAEIFGYTRSIENPWSFELSYHDDLFKTGILGFSFFLIFILGIFFLGFKLIKKDDFIMLGMLAGLLSFLVANGTNPFFSSFDYFWPFFLPLCYIKLMNKGNKIGTNVK